MDARWLWLIVAPGVVATVLGLAAWRLVRSLDESSRDLSGRVMRLPWRKKARLAWALIRDPGVPLWLRAVIPLLVLYLLMPLDIIPDFIPVLGHLDDLLAVLAAVAVLLRFTPRDALGGHLTRLEEPAGDV